MISKSDWASWKSHPVTKAYMNLLEQLRQETLQDVGVDLDSVEKTALRAAYVTGICQGLLEAIEMEIEETDDE